MIDSPKLYLRIDAIITEVDSAINESELNKEINRRNKNLVASKLDDNELLKILSHLIDYHPCKSVKSVLNKHS